MLPIIAFRKTLEFEYGVVEQVSPLIRRIIAPNPSAFTFHGTGTYIVGHGRVAVVDPGPALGDHIDAILSALETEEISHILVTHTHMDHSPAARPLQAVKGGVVLAYGRHGSGKIDAGHKVEEGGDLQFAPDTESRHGDVIEGTGWSIESVHTPGHTSNHLCYQLREEKALFSGDHVMGWCTSIISPPDGDMSDYMASLRLLLDRDDNIYWPTHGPSIPDPKPFVRSFIAHRDHREHQILECLRAGIGSIDAMVSEMYACIPSALHGAAARSVFAALIHLERTGRVVSIGEPSSSGRFILVEG